MENKKEVVIVSAVRTPFDKFGGEMKALHSTFLAQKVLEEVVNKINFNKADVEEIIYGSCIHEEIALYANVPIRQALLKAGYPATTLSFTIDRACCSSMTALEVAYKDILLGEREVAIACGAENLANSPYLLNRHIPKTGHLELYDHSADMAYRDWTPVSVDTDVVSKEYGITRELMDEWSYLSQTRCQAAKEKGYFDDEIVPITVKGPKGKEITISEDVSPRADTTIEKLSSLKTVYGTESITAGNAPGLNVGASAILLMTKEKADEFGLEPLAYILGIGQVADEAKYIPRVPAKAIQLMMKQNNITLDDIKLIEINEAFAAMPLVSTKILADGNEELLQHLRSITNVNGGAVAIGHPMGATGCRLVMTLMYELRRRGGGKGVAAICGGLAQGDGILLEVR